jgi:plasmid stabilization system protein ParE
MAANLFWRPQAREDLLVIYEFIGLYNPAAAERLLTSIEDKVGLLVHHPRMGPRIFRCALAPTLARSTG